MNTTRLPRLLTHDERKAAEAAFAGRPFEAGWSESAKRIYDGLIQAILLSPSTMEETPGRESSSPSETKGEEAETVSETRDSVEDSVNSSSDIESGDVVECLSTERQLATEEGWLIDVSEEAKKLGLTFPVTVTRPLWETGIAPDQDLSEEEAARRLRDVLMAFRLRLVGQSLLAPLVYFPAMLSFPPHEVPQPVLLSALIHADSQRHPRAILLLPHEVSMTVLPLN